MTTSRRTGCPSWTYCLSLLDVLDVPAGRTACPLLDVMIVPAGRTGCPLLVVLIVPAGRPGCPCWMYYTYVPCWAYWMSPGGQFCAVLPSVLVSSVQYCHQYLSVLCSTVTSTGQFCAVLPSVLVSSVQYCHQYWSVSSSAVTSHMFRQINDKNTKHNYKIIP